MPKFSPLDLTELFNGNHDSIKWYDAHADLIAQLPGGAQTFWGVPFLLGGATSSKRWLVLDAPHPRAEIPVNAHARYIVIAHFADSSHVGHELPVGIRSTPVLRTGECLANYTLMFRDGREHRQAIRRRFEINDAYIGWGQLPFAARPHGQDAPVEMRGPYPRNMWGGYQMSVVQDAYRSAARYWLFALPNPFPDQPLAAMRVEFAGLGRIAIGGITLFHGAEHPLRHRRLETMRITLDEPIAPEQIALDLGTITRMYAIPAFDPEAWLNAQPRGWGEESPASPQNEIVADITASADATLTIANRQIDLRAVYENGNATQEKVRVEILSPRKTWVHATIQDATTGKPTAARIHFRSRDGVYLPPYGHRHQVNDNWFEDYGGDLLLGTTQYAYVDGQFQIELPVGETYVEICKGFEYRPVRARLDIQPHQRELHLRLERPINLRDEGWVTADTHVHFISPETALLEARGEGINLVNLLASQWGDLFTNVADITGNLSGVSRDDTMVWVGTENRQHLLGHINLLGTHGKPVFPMCASGPSESFLGDPTWSSLAEWADACRAREGVVVVPHFPNPQCEIAADIVLGKVDAAEIRDFHIASLDTYATTEWYRFLNLGYRLAAVGGTDKMSAGMPVGGVRTYANLGDEEFTFANWGKAIRAGRTFTTSGPIIFLDVEGKTLGDEIKQTGRGGSIEIHARAIGVHPLHELQIVVNGQVVASETIANGDESITLKTHVHISRTSWIAARCMSRHKMFHCWHTFMVAHTSPVYVKVGDDALFNATDATYMLTLMDGGLAWLDTLSIPADDETHQRIRNVFLTAQNELHRRMHHPQ